MQTVLAIVLGILAGALGFLPLFAGLRLSRRFVGSDKPIGQMGICLLGLTVSFLALALAAYACVVVARPVCLPFVGSEVLSLVLVAVCYGVRKNRR